MVETPRERVTRKRAEAMPRIGKELSDYCQEHDIKNVIFMDRSARPAYMALKTDWDSRNDPKDRPNIYFVSPRALMQSGVADYVGALAEEQPYLLKDKDAPTLLFDVCVKEGGTMQNMTELLKKSGFGDVYSMVTALHEDKTQYFDADKVIFDDHGLGCHLFGSPLSTNNEVGVTRKLDSLLAVRDSASSSKVAANRKWIRDAVRGTYVSSADKVPDTFPVMYEDPRDVLHPYHRFDD